MLIGDFGLGCCYFGCLEFCCFWVSGAGYLSWCVMILCFCGFGRLVLLLRFSLLCVAVVGLVLGLMTFGGWAVADLICCWVL